MIESVLAMYSTPAHPMFKKLGSGTLTAEALKIAGCKADKASRLGWNVIRAEAGDRISCINISNELQKKKLKGNEILAVLEVVLPDHWCGECRGTKQTYSLTGKRWIACKACKGTGKGEISIADICEKYGANREFVEAGAACCYKARSDAEIAIKTFICDEKR